MIDTHLCQMLGGLLIATGLAYRYCFPRKATLRHSSFRVSSFRNSSLKKSFVKKAAVRKFQDPSFVQGWKVVHAHGEQRRTHCVNGKLHHPHEAASIVYYPDGSKVEEYYINGDRHRVGGPAIFKTEADGTRCMEYWINNHRHAEKGPAVMIERADGTQRLEFWRNTLQHRDNAPAVIEYNRKKQPIHEEFWNNGKLVYIEQSVVKENTVSVTDLSFDPFTCTRIRLTTHTDGRTEETYHRRGKLHREGGPARIITTRKGVRYDEYWVDGLPLKLDLNELPSLRRTSVSH